jgi:cyclophilin family peptidyl-prolyl cis-trans isomerase
MALGRWLPVALVVVLVGCGGGGKSDEGGTTTTAAATTDASGCTTVDQPKPEEREEAAPKQKLDPAKKYTVTLQTNCGSFSIDLAAKTSPATAASFVNLVRKGYFDHTIFHRIVPGFVIQGGDPTASGLGGPGYKTVDKPPASTKYTLGLVAMAKGADEPAGTSGSQFFVVTAQDAGLPPDYAVLGEVTKGMDVVNHIGELGDPGTEQPIQIVEIQKATVSVE